MTTAMEKAEGMKEKEERYTNFTLILSGCKARTEKSKRYPVVFTSVHE